MESEKASKIKAGNAQAEYRTADLEVAAEHTWTERAEHTARIARLYGYVHKFKGKLDFLERCNKVVDLRYSMQSYECVR